MKPTFLPSLKALTMSTILGGLLSISTFGQQSPGDPEIGDPPNNDNPDPGDCCQCLRMLINLKDTPPPEEDERFVEEADGSIKFKVTLTNLCVREISGNVQLIGIVPEAPEPVQTEPYVIPAGGTVTLDFTLDATARERRTKWRFQASCEGSLSGCPFRDFYADCESCIPCQLSGTTTVTQKSFIARIPTTPSQGGMTHGYLEYYSRGFGWLGRAGLNPVVPSTFVITRDGNDLITAINTGVTTLEVADVTGEDAFTVVHKNNATQQVIRSTKVEFVNEGGIDRLRMDTTFLGTTTRMEQTQPQAGTLILQKGRVNGAIFEPLSKETLVTTEPVAGQRILRRTLEERADVSKAFAVTSDVERTWVNQINGWRKVKEVVNPNAAGTSVSLTSTWSYYQPGEITGAGASTAGLGLLKHHVRYDGYESFHSYTNFSKTITTPFQGNVTGQTTTRTWNPVADSLTTITTVGGETVSQTVSTYGLTQTTTDRYNAAGQKLTTVKDYVASGLDFGGKTTRMLYPDGTLMTCSYTRDNVTGGYTKVQRNGATTDQTTVSLGTETTMVYNSRGTLIKSETKAVGFPGTGGRVYDSMAVTAIDIYGRPLTMAYHPDSIMVTGDQASATNPSWTTSRAYSCCGIASDTDRTGVTTYYAHDILQRRVKSNRLGVTMETVFDGLTTKSHRYPEIVAGSLSPTLSGTTANLVSSRTGNLSNTTTTSLSPDPNSQVAGAMVSTIMQVTYQPAVGIGTRTLMTYPDTSTQTTDSFLDGSTATSTGTASPEMTYSYAVNTTGLATTRSYLDGATLRETTTSQADWLGRTVLVTYQDTSTASMDYNTKGQLTVSTDPDGVSTVYGYNTRGQRTLSALDLNNNDQIDYGTDTISFSETDPGVDGAATVWVSISKVWQDGDTNPAAGTTTSTSYQAPDGLTSKTVQLGVAQPFFSTTILPGGGDWTVKSESADQSYTVATYVDGLLDKQESFRSDDTLISSVSMRDSSDMIGSGYDSINRVTRAKDSRTGISVTTFKSLTSDSVASVADPDGRTTTFNYDPRGRRTVVDAPNTIIAGGGTSNNITNTLYNLDGTVQEVNGDQTYRRTYTYDYADRMVTMTTYGTQNATTTWSYSQDRGFLTRKEYDDGKGTNYAYTSAGRLAKRIWERGNTTRYRYDGGGRLIDTWYFTSTTTQTAVDAAIAGNDPDTPDVSVSYDALSRPTSQSNGVATSAYAYDLLDLILDKETVTYDFNTDGTPELVRVLDRSQDHLLRPDGFSLQTAGQTPTADFQTSYSYDLAGRVGSVGQTGPVPTIPAASFDYGYQPNSYGLLQTVTGPQHKVTNLWETTRNVLDTKTNANLASTPVVYSAFDYAVNNIGQRTDLVTSGSAFGATQRDVDWNYDSLGQLVSEADNNTTAFNRGFAFDGIGNRTASISGDTDPTATGAINYTPDVLNQYTTITDPATQVKTPTYDDDGNATAMSLRKTGLPAGTFEDATLIWDAENRLIEIKAANNATLAAYQYDSQSRRIRRNETVADDTAYLYDGWNPIAEYRFSAGSYDLALTNLWGLDLSGSMQGAGGVGGLLAVTTLTLQNSQIVSQIYYPTYDGNGNISEYLDSTGANITHYEYDSFGNVVKSTESTTGLAATFSHRFSTKQQDNESGLLYYGYRYYDPVTGRWPSRDPIGERGGINLYNFVGNDVINRGDYLGNGWFGYDSWSEYWGEVADVFKGQAKGAAETLTMGAYEAEYENELQEAGGTQGEILATAAEVGTGVGAAKAIARKLAKEAAEKITKCEALHAAYKGLNCKGCKKCADPEEAKTNAACLTKEIAGRAAYLKMKCDYILPGSIARGSKKAEAGHKTQLAEKTKALALCVAKSNIIP